MRNLFIILCVFAYLPCYSQALLETKFNFQANDLTIEDALLQLSEKANCNISFNSQYFQDHQKVTIKPQFRSLQYFLKACLKNTDFTFQQEGNSIYLTAKQSPIYTISGFVEDSLSAERLVAATVYDQLSGKGTVTNEYGFFSIAIPKGEALLSFSYLGFQSRDYQISVRKDLILTIGLNASITLEEVVISDSKMQTSSAIGEAKAPSLQQLNQFPSLAGEPDVLKYFQNLPGVQTGSDGFGGMQVRGGEDHQNLVFLDGVPVYNPAHSLGLFSIFNTQTIKSATLYKGGFPARYSGRLSSVMDIRTREGSLKKYWVGVNFGLLATSLFAEGPIQKEKTGFLVSLRRTHIDPLINRAVSSRRGENIEGNTSYYFYDANIKLHHHLTNKDRLYLSFYKGNDAISDKSELEEDEEDCDDCEEESELSEQTNFLNYNWGNTILALRWNHVWHQQLFSNTTFTYSEFGFSNKSGSSDYFVPTNQITSTEDDFSAITIYQFRSNIKDIGLKTDVDYIPNSQHTLKVGMGLLVRKFKPTVLSNQFEQEGIPDLENEELEEDTTLLNPNFFATELNAYLEDKWEINEKWSAHYGMHATAFIAPNKIYPSLQPRLAIKYNASTRFKLQWSVSQMQQYLHVLQSSSTSIPNDLWVPSTDRVQPEFSWQTDFGWKWQLPNEITWSVEGYYKQLHRLIGYREDTDFLRNEPDEATFNWEEEVSVGNGKAYGLETSLIKNKGKTKGWLNYHLSWSDRQFPDINKGQRFPSKYNRRHTLNLGITQTINDKINLQAIWRYGSGQWTTLPILETSATQNVLDVFQPPSNENTTTVNTYQLKPLHRLDLTINVNWSKERWQHQLAVGLYNAYGRNNPILVYATEKSPNRIREVGLGWVIPSLRYGLRF